MAYKSLTVFRPLILSADLIFFLRSEIVLDIECLSDFFRGFALDHVGNGLASNVKQRFDVEIVGSLAETLAYTRDLGAANERPGSIQE